MYKFLVIYLLLAIPSGPIIFNNGLHVLIDRRVFMIEASMPKNSMKQSFEPRLRMKLGDSNS